MGFRGRIQALAVERRRRRPAGARTGAPADRTGLRRGRRRRAAAPGPVRRRSRSPCASPHTTIALRRREAMAILVSAEGPERERRRRVVAAGRRAGRQSQLRQDRAVQRPDRQPPEGRQLSRRHGREEGRPPHHAGRPHRRRSSTCPAPIRCARARPTRRSRATSCSGRSQSERRPGPDRLRRRRLQPAPGAAPRARAEAGRPAGDAVAQHDGHRAQARHRDRHRAACRANSACRS